MDALEPETFAGDGLLEIYQRLSAHLEQLGSDNVPPMMMCGLASLKLAMMMMVDAAHPGLVSAMYAGEEKLHAGDAMMQAAAVCTGATMLMHRRLVGIPGRPYSAQRAGKLILELDAIAQKLVKYGDAMMQEPEEGRAGNA